MSLVMVQALAAIFYDILRCLRDMEGDSATLCEKC